MKFPFSDTKESPLFLKVQQMWCPNGGFVKTVVNQDASQSEVTELSELETPLDTTMWEHILKTFPH